MLDFINRFFKGPSSSGVAKERLRLVLLSDRISLAPDVVEALKADLLEVISRYVEVDESHTEINFEQREREVAMLANIPILSLRPRPPLPPPLEPPPAPPAPPTSDIAAAVAAPADAEAAEAPVETKPLSASQKRRRRRAAAANFSNPAQAT